MLSYHRLYASHLHWPAIRNGRALGVVRFKLGLRWCESVGTCPRGASMLATVVRVGPCKSRLMSCFSSSRHPLMCKR